MEHAARKSDTTTAPRPKQHLTSARRCPPSEQHDGPKVAEAASAGTATMRGDPPGKRLRTLLNGRSGSLRAIHPPMVPRSDRHRRDIAAAHAGRSPNDRW